MIHIYIETYRIVLKHIIRALYYHISEVDSRITLVTQEFISRAEKNRARKCLDVPLTVVADCLYLSAMVQNPTSVTMSSSERTLRFQKANTSPTSTHTTKYERKTSTND